MKTQYFTLMMCFSFEDIGKAVADTKIIGAHWLAADYFTKSIEAGSCAFKSKRCTNYATYTVGL